MLSVIFSPPDSVSFGVLHVHIPTWPDCTLLQTYWTVSCGIEFAAILELLFPRPMGFFGLYFVVEHMLLKCPQTGCLGDNFFFFFLKILHVWEWLLANLFGYRCLGFKSFILRISKLYGFKDSYLVIWCHSNFVFFVIFSSRGSF